MLTSDLVQTRVYRKEVRPRYIDAEDEANLALARELIDLFAAHEGSSRRELEGELRELLGTGTEFLLHRSLAKLLFDRSTFETSAQVEPELLRGAVFEAAAVAYRSAEPATETPPEAEAPEDGDEPSQDEAVDGARRFQFDRNAVLQSVAGEHELSTLQVEEGLYADLKSEQILSDWKPCRPAWLLDRYNVALAQGVLYRAVELEIRIDGGSIQRHRELFRKIKFFQLMHRVEGDAEDGYTIRLDGPMSVFRASGRYGLQMASFLPTLLHFERWSLKAKLAWGKKRRELGFRLSPATGLRPINRSTGQWQPEELSWLPEQFDKLATDWRISTEAELVDLDGRGVLVPDFVFEHPNGLRVFMEVFGFWNRGAISSRLELLREHGPQHLILALSKQLATGREDLADLPAEIYVFRASPIARKVLKLLEQLRVGFDSPLQLGNRVELQ
ncbi:MAG: DUF790 family protein [Acidobacteriota bacterium]